MVASNNDRQKSFVERQKEQGRTPRKVYATPEEHEAIRSMLDILRGIEDKESQSNNG